MGKVMKKLKLFRGVAILTLLLLCQGIALAAPPGPCQGPNKNDPGCPGTQEPVAAAAAVVDSVTVDWFNQRLVVRGSGFTGTTEFLLGGNVTPLSTANVSDTLVELPFDANLASEVVSEGNYNLLVDGAVALSVYIESSIIDPAAAGCPCEATWSATAAINWGTPATDCVEVEGPAANDIADIAGTVLSDPLDPTVYPWYPIGASFYPGIPTDSYCELAQVDSDATVTELIHLPINENQQADCATLLKANVCNPIP